MKSLFLHPNDHRVTLANLFVMQDYREFCQNKEIKKEDLPDLPTRIANFIHQSTRPFLFIEGDAGSGKSTLIGWINHHSNLQDDIAKSLLDGKSLVTIRLRDLDKRTISNEGSLIPAILSYMRLCTVDNLEDEFPEAVVILDGFDELCMIDQITNYEELLYDLSSKRLNNYKFIITTRPKYIRLGKINIPHEYISLRHFDKGKRNEWLEKYSNPSFCNQSIAPEVRKFIEQIDDDNVSAICDTPMSLYMLAAKKIEIDSELNIWELYHQIFFEEISITQYNEMFPDPNRNYAHRIVKHRDILYQISEEIAYRMYSTGNSKLFLSSEELFEIICELNQRNGNFLDPPRVEMKLLAERCYALCNYWKADSSDGMVEFYHNNIRDFFLCEKIYREMNSIYNRFKTDSQYNSREAATTLCELFHFDILETTVNKFLLLRAKSDLKCGNQEFPSHEVIQEHLPEIFELMLTDGTIFDVKKSKNPIQFILNVLTCTAQIYRHVYEPFLWDNRLIKWWNSVSEVNKNGMIPQVFRAVFCQVPTALDSNSMLLLDSESMLTMASNGDFCGIDLQSCDLRNISFQSSKICNANFENTILCGCDFSDSILSDSNFTNADMQYVKLLGADMRRCILSGANLRGTDLPDGACGIGQDTQ